jgi:hypothetical protein
MEGLSMLFLGLEKESSELIQGCFRDPTFGALPAFPGADEPGVNELLEMMGDGGLANAEPPPQFADAKTGTFLGAASASLAAIREADKNRQAMRMRQRLEGSGEFSYAHTSIVIDIS